MGAALLIRDYLSGTTGVGAVLKTGYLDVSPGKGLYLPKTYVLANVRTNVIATETPLDYGAVVEHSDEKLTGQVTETFQPQVLCLATQLCPTL